ncbi:hypothetical protein HQN89_22200 [Paenibacillus frigoriresistens]|uniref:hypothetical protein n=1 Tax=Paenibacillus alginolyticus TaxID=59839 RepID=UPI001563110B|nr:hypothetical protein [Paenibacillus frigoriresistens]NRF93661.1 hypothetical protein [Paenibacillus frigoriresistens]
MSSKKAILLTHDPGGYSVVYPIFQEISKDRAVEMFCLGPSGFLNPLLCNEENSFLSELQIYLEDETIELLVTGTSWGTDVELRAIKMCEQFGVTTVSILDYWSGYVSRFRMQDGSIIYPDFLIVMDDLAYQEAKQDGVPESIMKVLGHPGLDYYISLRKLNDSKIGHPSKSNVLFLSQPIQTVYDSSLGFDEEIVLNDCIRITQEMNVNLHVKFHPKDRHEFIEKYSYLSVNGDMIDLLTNHDLVIGMSTVSLLHAVILNLPTISYQPNLKGQDLCITNKLGLTDPIYITDNFNEVLFNYLYNPNIVENVLESKNLIWLDGMSTIRIARYLKGLSER